ncbi:hypothetical protein EDD16DRAFT_1544197 [Pisolithus croceorrhizus]|nr:hypothetical protein EDD16DRAFT_1544197 [Pisolithus croceorrhizus]
MFTMFSLQHSLKQMPCGWSRGKIATPQDFLKAIGRNSEKRHFGGMTVYPVRDRRYILWCMEKFRQDLPIEQFAHEPKPKKKIRGWGPAVQHGKRIR